MATVLTFFCDDLEKSCQVLLQLLERWKNVDLEKIFNFGEINFCDVYHKKYCNDKNKHNLQLLLDVQYINIKQSQANALCKKRSVLPNVRILRSEFER